MAWPWHLGQVTLIFLGFNFIIYKMELIIVFYHWANTRNKLAS